MGQYAMCLLATDFEQDPIGGSSAKKREAKGQLPENFRIRWSWTYIDIGVAGNCRNGDWILLIFNPRDLFFLGGLYARRKLVDKAIIWSGSDEEYGIRSTEKNKHRKGKVLRCSDRLVSSPAD